MPAKEDRVKAFVEAYTAIETMLPLTPELLDFKPFEDAWTIRDNILHLLDADLNGIVRLKKAFAQPGTPIVTYDEEKWTKELSYESFPVEPVVALTKALRLHMADLLRTKVHFDWTTIVFSHPDNGLVSVDRWLEIYIEHVGYHQKLIQRNLGEWAKRQ